MLNISPTGGIGWGGGGEGSAILYPLPHISYAFAIRASIGFRCLTFWNTFLLKIFCNHNFHENYLPKKHISLICDDNSLKRIIAQLIYDKY